MPTEISVLKPAAAQQIVADAQAARDDAQTARDAAQTAETGAVTAQGQAEAAQVAAFVNADVYADIATGRAAVADGEQFQVVTGDEIIRYRRDSSSTQTEVARYPTAEIGRRGRDALQIMTTRVGLTSLARVLGPDARIVAPVELGWLWQDAGKTVPATEDGDPVVVIADQSGRGNDIVSNGAVPGILRRDGVNCWLEVSEETSPYLVPQAAYDFSRINLSYQFCLSATGSRSDATVWVIRRQGSPSRISLLYSTGNEGELRFRWPSAGNFTFPTIRRAEGLASAVSFTVDGVADVARVRSGAHAVAETEWGIGDGGAISGSSGDFPQLLLEHDPSDGNRGTIRFYGFTLVGRTLTEEDHHAFRQAVEPKPVQSPEIMRLRREVEIIRSQVIAPVDHVASMVGRFGSAFIRPTRHFCFQDAQAQVPVQMPGDEVRIVLDQSGSDVSMVFASGAPAIYQSDGVNEWLEPGNSSYRLRGLGTFDFDEIAIFMRVSQTDNTENSNNNWLIENPAQTGVSSSQSMSFARTASGIFRVGSRANSFSTVTVTPPSYGDDIFGMTVSVGELRGFRNGEFIDSVPFVSFGSNTLDRVHLFSRPGVLDESIQGKFYGLFIAQGFGHLTPQQRYAVNLALRQPIGGGAPIPDAVQPLPIVDHLWIGDIA